MNIILKFIHKLISRNRGGGWVTESIGDGVSPKFQSYREKYGALIFGSTPPETLGRAKRMMEDPEYPNKMFCFQNSILSCVSCAIVEVKNYFSGWRLFFSWRWIYGQVAHYNGGTRFKDNMKIAQAGMLLDSYLPQRNYWAGEIRMQTLYQLVKGIFIKMPQAEFIKLEQKAEKRTLGIKWSYIYAKDRTAIKHAVTKAPCPIGLYVYSNWYSSKPGDVIQRIVSAKSYGHLVTIFDWSDKEQCWYVSDHDAKGFRKISYNYPLSFVAFVEDGEDGEEENTMLKIIKKADSPDFYVVWADNTKSHIPNWELFTWGNLKGLWVGADKVEIIKDSDFGLIPEDTDNNHLLSIISEFNKSNKE